MFKFDSRIVVALIVIVLGALGAAGTYVQTSAAEEGEAKIAPEIYEILAERPTVSVIVSLRKPARAEPGSPAAQKEGAEAVDGVLATLAPSDFELIYRWNALFGLSGTVTDAGLVQLAANPGVEGVALDKARPLALGQSRPLINADDALGLGFDGTGTVVAVLDTGTDTDHPDFAGRIVAEACFLSAAVGAGGNACPGGGTTETGGGAADDDDGHGTNVTGIMAGDGSAARVGVAPNAGIIAYKICSTNVPPFFDTRCFDSDWIEALDDLRTNQVAAFNVTSANMSLGSGVNATSCDGTNASATNAITSLRAAGVLTFVATGNNGSKAGIAYPACISTAVSVGAVYDSDVGQRVWTACTDASSAADQVTCSSQSANILDLLAPGSPITAAGMGGGASTYSGTSQASPHAAGLAALVAQANSSLTADQIQDIMEQTGVLVTDAANGITTPRINALGAVLAASCFGLPATIIGTAGDDIINGTSGADVIVGLEGNDTIRGFGGNDRICGGPGDDEIRGEVGDDSLGGGIGDDTIFGNAGADILIGGIGADELNGGPGNDIIEGNLGNDLIRGGTGDDDLRGDEGRDKMHGGDGLDTLDGGDGNDVMRGNDQRDILLGRGGNDTIYGGDGPDTVNGGIGDDTIRGGSGNDVLNGNAGNDNIRGNNGSDTINGGVGSDTLRGDAFGDEIDGGSGRDFIYGGKGGDILIGGTENDQIRGGSGTDNIQGGDGNDRIWGNSGDDALFGGAGTDRLAGGPGKDGCTDFDLDTLFFSCENAAPI